MDYFTVIMHKVKEFSALGKTIILNGPRSVFSSSMGKFMIKKNEVQEFNERL